MMKKIFSVYGSVLLILFLYSLLPGVRHSDKAAVYPEPPSAFRYDCIVAGAEPEGVAAALSAARRGADVLLIGEEERIGGLLTSGGLNFWDMNYGPEGETVTKGIAAELHESFGGGTVFDPLLAEAEMAGKLKDAGVFFLPDTSVAETLEENGVITGIITSGGETYTAGCFIDATADGDLYALAGEDFTRGGEDYFRPDREMASTLVFKLENVNWPKVFLALNCHRIAGALAGDERRYEGAKLTEAWGYNREGYGYQPVDEDIRLRGFNMAKVSDGSVWVNAMLIFGVDPFSETDREEAFRKAEEEMGYLLPYVRENFFGFEEASLQGFAEDLYVRESRHLEGLYRLTLADVLENRGFADRIALASYPVDIQPDRENVWGSVAGDPDLYSIPFRSLVPAGSRNLLVVGRSASYDSLAAGSARVVPVGIACGEAAGAAAVLARENEMDFHQLAADAAMVRMLQEDIVSGGGYLPAFSLEPALTDDPDYPSLSLIRSLGLIGGGYGNDYRLDALIDRWQFLHIAEGTAAALGYKSVDPGDEYISYPSALRWACGTFLGKDAAGESGCGAALLEAGIISRDESGDYEIGEIMKVRDVLRFTADIYVNASRPE